MIKKKWNYDTQHNGPNCETQH